MKSKNISIIIVCALLLFGCKTSVEEGLSYDQYISKAEQAISESKVEKAILYYRKALELKPSDANTHYILAQIYDSEYKQSYQEAVNKRLFQLMTHPDPNRQSYNDGPKELKPYGLKAGYDEKAIQEFREAVKYDSNNWQARHWIAIDYFNKKQFKKSIEELQQVIQINPDFSTAYSVMGQAYMELGSLDLAAKNLQTAIRLDPGFADYTYYKLALVYRKMNSGDKVAEILKMLKATKSVWYDQLRLSLYD